MLYGDKLLTQIEIIWCDADVLERADELEITLSKEEVSNVLFILKKKHDATLGLSWDTIDYAIGIIVDERKQGKT